MRNVPWLILFVFLSACSTTIPNTRFCSVAGRLEAGMNCAFALEDRTEELDVVQAIAFLEPQLEPPQGGAICMSSKDFQDLKTALDKACSLLKGRCRKAQIEQISARLDKLQNQNRIIP